MLWVGLIKAARGLESKAEGSLPPALLADSCLHNEPS